MVVLKIDSENLIKYINGEKCEAYFTGRQIFEEILTDIIVEPSEINKVVKSCVFLKENNERKFK